MCWIKKGEGFYQGNAEFLAFFNLVKVAEEVTGRILQVKLDLQNFSNNPKIL
jgi:hypothetical protein